MALTLSVHTSDSLALPDYLEYMSGSVDPHNLDAVLESASALKALANNPMLIVDELNDEFRRAGNLDHYQAGNGYSAQTLVLGKGPGFIVRANVWLPPAATALERDSQRSLSAYQLPHDHDFSFLTVGYWGSGYATSIWEYDSQKVVGRIREPVDLTFLEHTTLPRGKVMFYRASKDVHSQEYPSELSVSLNLLLLPDNGSTSQYMFDPGAGVISGIIPNVVLTVCHCVFSLVTLEMMKQRTGLSRSRWPTPIRGCGGSLRIPRCPQAGSS